MQIIEKDIDWLLERVPDFMQFYDNHRTMFEGGYLAGGFMRAMILKGSAEAASPSSQSNLAGDIDFFYFTPVFCHNAISEIAKVVYAKQKIGRFSSNPSVTGYAHDFYDRQTQVKYQLIIKNTGSPYEVLNRFDISNCKIATDGKKVWMIEDWEQLENNKQIRIDNYAGDYIFKRVKKYLFRNKGYTLWNQNRDEMIPKMLERSNKDPASIRSLLNVMKDSFTKEKITIFYGLLGNIDETEKDGTYEAGSLNKEEDFALHMYKRMAEKEITVTVTV